MMETPDCKNVFRVMQVKFKDERIKTAVVPHMVVVDMETFEHRCTCHKECMSGTSLHAFHGSLKYERAYPFLSTNNNSC
jgi:hypothetical protein